jgi:hypothetical protein
MRQVCAVQVKLAYVGVELRWPRPHTKRRAGLFELAADRNLSPALTQ